MTVGRTILGLFRSLFRIAPAPLRQFTHYRQYTARMAHKGLPQIPNFNGDYSPAGRYQALKPHLEATIHQKPPAAAGGFGGGAATGTGAPYANAHWSAAGGAYHARRRGTISVQEGQLDLPSQVAQAVGGLMMDVVMSTIRSDARKK
ncbi:hypothetical protein H696_03660 [Fonticula alba]|uniref:Uncharacterized protein n=1 Tax=Fonticula alba TaxID=691883 RepID=A0A058Z9K0_FONAL|nr:hypothetical protein H696_03660 [Fonticula alba]KCV70202.1 hypothetical protein H696_03660 [Fonticula alba]|eukprot:XP_009495808.1 hypothetical protein H696_03660 [Fonticula alba]